MAAEVAATVFLPLQRRVVRRYLIRRWVESDFQRVARARITAGAEPRSGPARAVLPVFDSEAGQAEDLGVLSRQAFEVEAHGVLWRYELEATNEHETRLHMAWVQTNWIGSLPGIRAFMGRGMERERARLARWAASETPE